jgi:Gpi18-like mannosyltransferase
MLALISTWYVSRTVIIPHVDGRIEHADKVLSGQQSPPYQYRVLKPILGTAFESAISPLIGDRRLQHIISYGLLSFMTFLGIFLAFYSHLQRDFSGTTPLIGVLALQVVIPLSTTGYYMEGDFINLLFYILGLSLIQREKDGYLPALVGLGTLNREQFVFILIWYFAWLIGQRKLTLRSILLALASLLVWFAVYAGIRAHFGFKPSQYTVALHLASNLNLGILFTSILPLWISNVAGFVVLSIFAFRRSNTFHRLSFLSLLAYVVLFFVNGNMWELAKFLPAYLIMIPMSLQILTGEYISDANLQNKRPEHAR